MLQDPSSAALIRRTFQQRLNDPPVLSFGALPNQAGAGQLQGSGLALHFSAMANALPFNVHLLTLKALPQSSVLLRLAHLYQVKPFPLWSTGSHCRQYTALAKRAFCNKGLFKSIGLWLCRN